MANPVTVFKASAGLNTQLDPNRLIFDAETGITELAVAYNVDHDYTGRVSRRKGFASTAITDSCHSLFCDGGDALFVTGTGLCLLFPDVSGYQTVATVTEGAAVSYAQVAGTIYYVNGFEKGYVAAGTNHAWTKGTYYGPTSDRTLSDPPIGTLIAAIDGRIYIAQGSVLFYSDPYSLNAFDLARGYFQFESDVTMVRKVTEGIFVGTASCVWFLRGTSPKNYRLIKASRSPVYKGTDVLVELADLTPKEFLQNRTGEAVMWTGPEGVTIGMPDGQVNFLTRDKIDELSAIKGGGAVINGRYVCTLAP